MTPQLPADVAEQVAQQRARLRTLGAERLTDDPGTDPTGWRRRESDRAALEASAAARIEQLYTDATNATAVANARPVISISRCCGCARRLNQGSHVEQADGPVCVGCLARTPAERAQHRAVRAVPTAELDQYLAGLPDVDLRQVARLVGDGPRDAHDLRLAVERAVKRRRRRDMPAHPEFRAQRRRFQQAVDRSSETTSAATRAGWNALNAELRPTLGPSDHLDRAEVRRVLDGLDRGVLRDVGRLAARLKDYAMEAVLAAEQRRRRTAGGARSASPDDAA